ncbi:hypothetical protein AM593_03476, partial [Mytilus galloprovincialis]
MSLILRNKSSQPYKKVWKTQNGRSQFMSRRENDKILGKNENNEKTNNSQPKQLIENKRLSNTNLIKKQGKTDNERNLKKSLTIKDISGKEMKAVDVFAACIEHLKNATFTRAKEGISNLEEEDIHWVLTVPAIWTEAARQFMIEAAEKGGIHEDNLTLALEPEAAALCCKSLEIQKREIGHHTKLGSFSAGSRFLVVDLGGYW